MRALGLFSGTKSIGNAFERLGYHETVSVDSDPTYDPSRLVDIMLFPEEFLFSYILAMCCNMVLASSRDDSVKSSLARG